MGCEQPLMLQPKGYSCTILTAVRENVYEQEWVY